MRRPRHPPALTPVREAGFPRTKRIEDFDFEANPNINPATVNALATGG